MENQYYIPAIEEFHLGFRYELKDLPDNLVNDGFRETAVWFTADLYKIYNDLQSKKIRVKCLNVDDIKDIEWELINEDNDIIDFIRPVDTYNIDGRFAFLRLKGNVLIKIYKDKRDFDNDFPCFMAFVKNYNELLKVMRILGFNVSEMGKIDKTGLLQKQGN